MGWYEDEQKAGREAARDYERRHPAPPPPQRNDALSDERMFRRLVLAELLAMRGDLAVVKENLNHHTKQLEKLMSATTDLQAAEAAIDVRLDALGDLVTASVNAIMSAITALAVGQNPDGSVPADVANAVVEGMKIHLASVETKVGDLGAAVHQLSDTVTPPAPAAPPA